MIKLIDKFLNQTTMYRLVLYYIFSLWFVAFVLSFFGLMPYGPLDLAVSLVFILSVCLIANAVFAYVFEVPSNTESVYATGIILALIVSPSQPFSHLVFLGWVALLAMASKYILAIHKKHIFNPAALAVALTAAAIGQSANWWVSNSYLTPFVLVGGLLIVRKLRRYDLVFSFLASAIVSVLVFNFFRGGDIWFILEKILFYSPVLFLGFAMLTEPSTTPATKNTRMLYGALVGFLFTPFIHIGSVYSTPELALLVGNIFAYIVNPKTKLILRLLERTHVANGVYDFVFKSDNKLSFKPGQYMEWTLGHNHQDARGMRRYFTIASSPTENNIRMGVKFYPDASSFKKSMLLINPGDKIVASQLAGDFVLPKDKNKKLVFIAGGIGITPFRSMTKYLLDTKEKRDIVLLYSNYAPADIAYKNIFDQAEKELGMKTIYTITGEEVPADWRGERGYIDEKMIERAVPDFKDRIFYLSGSHSMVMAFDTVLQKMGVSKSRIIKDYFPGFV